MRALQFIPLVSVGLVLAACEQPLTSPDTPVDPPSFASANAASSVKVPFAQGVFVSCADGGLGEFLIISGTLHIVSHTSFDNNGGFHDKFHFQPLNTKGTGPVTGDTYRGVGVTQQTLNISGDGLPFEFTFVNNFRMIGTGKGAVSFHVHETFHVTINNNGVPTAQVAKTRITCG